MSGTIHLWRIHCATDNRYEHVWSVAQPTVCPVDAGHALSNQSIWTTNIVRTVHQTQRVVAANSPFSVGRKRFYRCDTTAGAITVTLPPSTAANSGAELHILKESADANAVTVQGHGGNLIDGAVTATLPGANNVLKVASNGDGTWTSVELNTMSDAHIDVAVPTADKNWVFNDTKANAVQGGTNVANAWTTRAITNTVADDGAEVQRTGNELTLEQGSYLVRAEATFYLTEFTRMRLYNVTDAAVEFSSLNASAHADNTITVSLNGVVTVPTASKTYRIEYHCTRAQDLTGLGRANGTGDAEVYAVVHVVKFA